MEQIGIIKEVGEKQGNRGPYHSVTIDKWHYNLFQQHAGAVAMARENLGARAKVTYSENGQFRDFESLEILPDAPESKSGGGNGNDMSKDDWAMKDRRISRVAIAKAIIKALSPFVVNHSPDDDPKPILKDYADFWFNWVYEITGQEKQQGQPITELPEREEPRVEGAPIFFESPKQKGEDGIPVSRVQALNDLTVFKGKSVRAWSKSHGIDKALVDCTDDDLYTLFTAMRTEQEAL